jgi:hypothetical protein
MLHTATPAWFSRYDTRESSPSSDGGLLASAARPSRRDTGGLGDAMLEAVANARPQAAQDMMQSTSTDALAIFLV